MYAIGESERVITGSIRPAEVEPFAGKRGIAIVKVKRSSVPIINDGIDTNAVVITIITLSIGLLRLRAATDPRTMPIINVAPHLL